MTDKSQVVIPKIPDELAGLAARNLRAPRGDGRVTTRLSLSLEAHAMLKRIADGKYETQAKSGTADTAISLLYALFSGDEKLTREIARRIDQAIYYAGDSKAARDKLAEHVKRFAEIFAEPWVETWR